MRRRPERRPWLRAETRDKLDAVMRSERSASFWTAVAAVVAGLALSLYLAPTRTASGKTVTGIVRHATFNDGLEAEPPRLRLRLEVRLDDGRLVQVWAPTGTMPSLGQRVVLAERIDWFGRASYAWQATPP